MNPWFDTSRRLTSSARTLLALSVALVVGLTAAATAQAQSYSYQGAANLTPVAELITPVTDDLGHYVPLAQTSIYPVMGAVDLPNPVTSVTVNGAPTVLYPINYRLFNGTNTKLTGFRALISLQPTSLLQVVITDAVGGTRELDYLPDSASVVQRLTFWRQWRPEDPFVALRLATANAMLGNYDLALDDYGRFIDSHPEYGIARQLRALTFWDMGRWTDAAADLNFLVNNHPDAYPPHLDLGRLLLTMGNYDEATTHLQYALNMAPNAAETHYLLGQAYRSSGNLVLASNEQAAALENDATMAPALYEQGLVEAERGDTGDALHSMRRTLQNNPRYADAYLALARLRYDNREYRRAWEAVRRAERLGAVADPAFLDTLSAAMHEPFTPYRPRNYQRPGP